MTSLKLIKPKNEKDILNKKYSRENRLSDVEYLCKSIPQLDKICNVKKKIGQGTFSKVYYGEAKTKNDKFESLWAIKHIVPTAHPARVVDEIACLKLIGGSENVIAAIHCLRNENHIALIMPYIHSENFRDYVGKLKPQELSNYMHQLLIALNKVHSSNYIHRDVKPSNFLYSRRYDRCALIDFGLVQTKCQALTPTLIKDGLKTTKISSNMTAKRTREGSECDSINPPKRILINSSQKTIAPKSLLDSPPRDVLKKTTNRNVNGFLLDSPSKHTRAAEHIRKIVEVADVPKHTTNNVQTRLQPSILEKQNKPNCSYSALQKEKTGRYTSKLILQQVRTRNGRNELRMMKNTCNCFGAARVCKLCLDKSTQFAHRSGTPGFRAPEVLLKHPKQTTAVDIWSVGVILLCLLSGRYPFFQAVDDCVALAEISTLLGTQAIKKIAEKLQKKFIASEERPALSLFIICESLRTNNSSYCHSCQKNNECSCKNKQPNYIESPDDGNGTWNIGYPHEFYDLLVKLLDPNPSTRITASDALKHPIFSLYKK